MSISLKVRGIKALNYQSAQFAKLFLFLLEENNKKQKVYAFIRYELHLVDGLKANILIGNNIIISKSFVLNIRLSQALMESCGVKITIKAK